MWRWRERRFEENERGIRSEAITHKSDIKGGEVAKVQQRIRKKEKRSRLDRRTKCSRHGAERRRDRIESVNM